MFDLTGHAALVTGGSRGIGRAIALAFAQQGADVAVNYQHNAAAAEEAVGEITRLGRQAVAIQGSTADGRDGCEAIVHAAVEALGKVDILVNNAGITRDDLIIRMDPEGWDAVIDTNLSGPFWMTKAVARPMMKLRWGRIINMSSVAGRMGNVGQANYVAAKAGLIGLTKSVARELASRNVTANAVTPGYIETEMTAGLPADVKAEFTKQIPLGRMGSPADIAAAVAFLCSDEAAYVTGQILSVNGGMLMP